MEQPNCPDSWMDEPGDGTKAYGDSAAMNEMACRTATLNIAAAPFVPGKNIHAREFVPSFTVPAVNQPAAYVNSVSTTSSSKHLII